MIHPDLQRLYDAIRTQAQHAPSGTLHVSMTRHEWRLALEAIKWHGDMFDVGTEVMRRAVRDSRDRLHTSG